MDINQELNQSEWRVGNYYNSPAHLMSAYGGPYGTPYWAYGIPLQVPYPGTIEAPNPPYNKTPYTAVQVQLTPVQGYGQAPMTSYTGVEDTCHG